MSSCTQFFIPSYHRPHNKTLKWLHKIGYDMKCVHVFIDSEADDIDEYRKVADFYGCHLFVFDMDEARRRYDYVHRAPESRRSAGQARNMFQDYAKDNGIDFYVVQDDDTSGMYVRFSNAGGGSANIDVVLRYFNEIEAFMRKHHIGLFGLPQTGDLLGGLDGTQNKWFINKVMNTTFYMTKYVYRGERGVQDDDTSLFCGVMNEGLFTGSLRYGLVLQQTESAVQAGWLTDLYHECKLLNKSLVVPIQFPSAVYAEKQVKNGGRLHHHINNKYLFPRIVKGSRSNIAWDTYDEDYPFTNEPINRRK